MKVENQGLDKAKGQLECMQHLTVGNAVYIVGVGTNLQYRDDFHLSIFTPFSA